MISYLVKKTAPFSTFFPFPSAFLSLHVVLLLGCTGKDTGDSGLNPHPVYFSFFLGFVRYLEIILGH